jgi:small subunit ribosomal protein S18
MSEEIVKNTIAASEDVFDETKSVTTDDDSSTSDSYSKSKKKPRRRKYVQNLKCPLCESGVKDVTYKDIYQLKKFTSVRGKIISTEKSGVCHNHQRQLTRAIKRARYMALLPFVAKD